MIETSYIVIPNEARAEESMKWKQK